MALLILMSIVLSPGRGDGLVFGLNTVGVPVDVIEYYMPSGSGGVTFLKEESFTLERPYEGMYLWSRMDQRLDDLPGILPQEGEIHLVHCYTPRWVSGWFTHAQLPEGEVNNRPVGWDDGDMTWVSWFSNDLDALVRRYGPGGIYSIAGGRQIRSWGLWTEPDGGSLMVGFNEFSLTPSSMVLGLKTYHDIASLGSETLRGLDPSAEIVAGGFLSPMSSREPDQWYEWQDHARDCIQLMFGRETGFTVEFDWSAEPDALDWHPYDGMILDQESDSEWHYDPLVLDAPSENPPDFMYRYRADELADPGSLNLLDLWFTGDPDWDSMPQKLLEYCPTYSMDLWRSEKRLPTPAEFYTRWRANFFVTSTLMLCESEHVTTLAPMCSGDGDWWVEQYDPFLGYSMIDNEGFPNICDAAFAFQSSQLAGRHCSLREQLVPISAVRSSSIRAITATHWEFERTTQPTRNVHCLRTSRVSPDDAFDPLAVYLATFQVRPMVVSVNLLDMAGNDLGTYTASGQSVTVPVDGYVRYAVENLCLTDGSQLLPSGFLMAHDREGSIVEVRATRVASICVYDVSGRLVDRLGVEREDPNDGIVFCWDYGDARAPAGCYCLVGFDGEGDITASAKVVIW